MKGFKCGKKGKVKQTEQYICPPPRKGGDWYQIFSISPLPDAWRGTCLMSEDTLDLLWASEQYRLRPTGIDSQFDWNICYKTTHSWSKKKKLINTPPPCHHIWWTTSMIYWNFASQFWLIYLVLSPRHWLDKGNKIPDSQVSNFGFLCRCLQTAL